MIKELKLGLENRAEEHFDIPMQISKIICYSEAKKLELQTVCELHQIISHSK